MKINIDNKVLISIVMPAYNADTTIIETLLKLQQQIIKNFEVVIVNDGSTDDTEIILNKFIMSSSLKIKLINQTNKGEGEARNTGLHNAKGQYVLFLDADDYLAEDALAKLYATLIINDADLSFSSYSYVYSDGTQKLYYHQNRVYKQVELMMLFFRRLANPGIGNTLIKKSIIDNNHVKFEKYKAGADNHFFRKILLYANKIVSIEDNLFFYIYNNSSVMNTKYSFNRLDSIYSVLDTINDYKTHKIDKSIIQYLDIFLISEVRGNAMDFYDSSNDIKTLQENILLFLPRSSNIKLYFSKNRSLWLFSLYLFYKFPLYSLKLYKIFKGSKL